MQLIKDSFSKPYKITFEHRPLYLYAYISGEKDSYEISKQFWLDVLEEVKKTSYKKVLIEEDIVEEISLGEVYQLASEIPQMGFFGIRVAFVDRFLEHQASNEFGELVAVNRGFYGKVFNSFETGEKWLLSE